MQSAATGKLFKTKKCSFFVKGMCTKGVSCTFAHDGNELNLKPDFFRTSMCPDLMSAGKCTRRHCRFAHCNEELREPLERTKKRAGSGCIGVDEPVTFAKHLREVNSTYTALEGQLQETECRELVYSSVGSSAEEAEEMKHVHMSGELMPHGNHSHQIPGIQGEATTFEMDRNNLAMNANVLIEHKSTFDSGDIQAHTQFSLVVKNTFIEIKPVDDDAMCIQSMPVGKFNDVAPTLLTSKSQFCKVRTA